ncbi:hypothetical protein [Microvirga calopogonii]|uniref:hypothetical protein n=1 Tax=Microvirga calopogonii TaxID=2078013 RepID=UPI003CCA9114
MDHTNGKRSAISTGDVLNPATEDNELRPLPREFLNDHSMVHKVSGGVLKNINVTFFYVLRNRLPPVIGNQMF